MKSLGYLIILLLSHSAFAEKSLSYNLLDDERFAESEQAPMGYSWLEIPEISTRVLKPHNWFFKSIQKNSTLAYYLSKENIDQHGSYKTGLGMNVLPDVSQKGRDMTAEKYATGYITLTAQKKQLLKKPWKTAFRSFNAFGVLLYNKASTGNDYITYHLAIANNKTHAVYLLIYESPANEWDQAWKDGKPMLKALLLSLDPSF